MPPPYFGICYTAILGTQNFGFLIEVVHFAKFMDIRPLINLGRLVVVFLFILFVIFSRTSMLRDNPLSGILG